VRHHGLRRVEVEARRAAQDEQPVRDGDQVRLPSLVEVGAGDEAHDVGHVELRRLP
jgi:hypothetical protein